MLLLFVSAISANSAVQSLDGKGWEASGSRMKIKNQESPLALTLSPVYRGEGKGLALVQVEIK